MQLKKHLELRTNNSPNSLLNIPLVSQMFEDPNIEFAIRGLDKKWVYRRELSGSATGFLPQSNRIFVAKSSQAGLWIDRPEQNARKFNYQDRLIEEVAFLVHDYLHIWAYQWIFHLLPKVGFGLKEINRKNIEDFTFLHLATEAVATVGLDYWYLSEKNINDLCSIGSSFSTLTVSYRENMIAEYQKFFSEFSAQSEKFYTHIAKFYCTGVFNGFNKNDLKNSPVLYRWLEHELSYGANQRIYTRQWLSSMSVENIKYTDKQLSAPVKLDRPWKKKILEQIGSLLWQKVKNEKTVFAPRKIPAHTKWRVVRNRKMDFRFINFNSLTNAEIKKIPELLVPESYSCLFRQVISRLDYDKFSPEFLSLIPTLRDVRHIGALLKLARIFPTIKKQNNEPRDIFVLN